MEVCDECIDQKSCEVADAGAVRLLGGVDHLHVGQSSSGGWLQLLGRGPVRGRDLLLRERRLYGNKRDLCHEVGWDPVLLQRW